MLGVSHFSSTSPSPPSPLNSAPLFKFFVLSSRFLRTELTAVDFAQYTRIRHSKKKKKKKKKKEEDKFFFRRVQITNNNDDDDDDDNNNNNHNNNKKSLIQSLILNPPLPTTSTLMTSGKFRFTLYYVINIASSGRLLGHKQSIIKLFERPHFNQHFVTGFARSERC